MPSYLLFITFRKKYYPSHPFFSLMLTFKFLMLPPMLPFLEKKLASWLSIKCDECTQCRIGIEI